MTEVAVLAGGVGAARFLQGLVQVVEPERITVIVNTGDDLFHSLTQGLWAVAGVDLVLLAAALAAAGAARRLGRQRKGRPAEHLGAMEPAESA